ncbi:Hypothetical predicted protein [Mytilus galloprovincialis]|uniref:Reverse transcriptase RNase H-like domain-containing protein n=1 Tax=Mytilus galloprovincialis TaxID=29158 RepID=A0A8B6DS91_MYTGA|nr:Hypothetical predicted protein [Mytilus galloprovincialis]
MSEKVVVARIRGSFLPDEIIGLTSASPKLLSSGLMTAKSISKVDKNQILFGVGNFTDKPITLSKQCNLGKFVCLSKHDKLYDFESLDTGSRVCNVSKSSIDVKNQADKTLSVDQISQLQDLVDKYNDVFVGKDSKLGYPQYDQPFRLYTDASSFSLGAVLCQVQNGIERVICYAGKSLSASEKNYGISEKECLALVYGIKHFDCYLRHNKFEAFVDHSSLKWLLTMNEPVGKFARWNALVQSYDFDIKYRPGKIHTNADGISRRTYDDEVDHSDNWDELPTFDCISQPIKDTQRRAELPNDAAKAQD